MTRSKFDASSFETPLYAGIFSGKLPPKFRIANATAPANSCAHTELTEFRIANATAPANSCAHTELTVAQEVELPVRNPADPCLLLVHCQLQLAHDLDVIPSSPRT